MGGSVTSTFQGLISNKLGQAANSPFLDPLDLTDGRAKKTVERTKVKTEETFDKYNKHTKGIQI